MQSSELIAVWSSVVKNVESQLILNGENKDLFLNPIINDIYLRESAFACKILMTEFQRTKNNKYSHQADQTLKAISNSLKVDNNSGLQEPVIGTRSYTYNKGSLPATAIFVHALQKAFGREKLNSVVPLPQFFKFVQQCYLGKGAYSHDLILKNSSAPQVVNTSAMAAYLLTLSSGDNHHHKQIIDTIEFIKNSQRSDGLWLYYGTSKIDKLAWKCRKLIPAKFNRLYLRVRKDKSVYFGDYLHHVVSLYYLLCCVENIPKLKDQCVDSIVNSLLFISNHTFFDKHYAQLDFSWEPSLINIRHCNFFDSSTYFYLAASLLKIHKLYPSISISCPPVKFYFNYINKYLFQSQDGAILPYDQASSSQLNKIVPRPAESIFDKAFLLSFLIDDLLIHE